MASGTVRVELDDDADARPPDDDGGGTRAAADPEDPRSRRRRRWWLAGAAVVVVLALAAAQGLLDARQRAAWDALRDRAPMLAPLGPTLAERWRPTGPELVVALTSGARTRDAVVLLRADVDGAISVVAVDPVTGTDRWTTPLLDQPADLTQYDGTPVAPGACTRLPDDPSHVACLTDDAVTVVDDENGWGTWTAPTQGRFVVVDAADGHLVADRTLPADEAQGSLVALPGGVVVHGMLGEGEWSLVGLDAGDGHELWRTRVPFDDEDPDGAAGSLNRAGDTVLALGYPSGGGGGAATGAFVGSDGAVRRALTLDAGTYYQGSVAGGLVVVDADGTTTLLRPDRSLPLDGQPLTLSVDDGSLGDLVLTGGAQVYALDADGAPVWTSDTQAYEAGIVLDGRLYLTTDGAATALDGRTGETLWSAPLSGGAAVANAMTDGHLLLVPELGEAAGGLAEHPRLVALDLASGAQRWTVPLPEDTWMVGGESGVLLVWTGEADEPAVWG